MASANGDCRTFTPHVLAPRLLVDRRLWLMMMQIDLVRIALFDVVLFVDEYVIASSLIRVQLRLTR